MPSHESMVTSPRNADMTPLPTHEQLRKSIHVIVVRAVWEDRELMHKVVDPGPLVDESSVRPGVGQVHVPGFDTRLRRVGPRELAAFGLDGNDARKAMF